MNKSIDLVNTGLLMKLEELRIMSREWQTTIIGSYLYGMCEKMAKDVNKLQGVKVA